MNIYKKSPAFIDNEGKIIIKDLDLEPIEYAIAPIAPIAHIAPIAPIAPIAHIANSTVRLSKEVR